MSRDSEYCIAITNGKRCYQTNTKRGLCYYHDKMRSGHLKPYDTSIPVLTIYGEVIYSTVRTAGNR
jgi:hypothetical protein